DLLQGQFAAFVVQFLKPVEAVPAIPHHLAGLADVAELLGQLQKPRLHPNDLLLLSHIVDLRPAGTNNDCQVKFELIHLSPTPTALSPVRRHFPPMASQSKKGLSGSPDRP